MKKKIIAIIIIIKSEFTGFKVLNPICFCHKLDGEIIINKKKEFIDTFEELTMKRTKFFKNGKEKKIKESFIKEWLVDEDKKIYHKMDFLPRGNSSPKIYNTFTGYKADKNKDKIITGKLKESRIWKHLFNLSCKDDIIFNYMLKWLALRIQKPYSTNINSSIVISGAEGTGKNLFFDWFGSKIIGRKYYNCAESLDNVFGKFNSQLNDKILVVINELDSNAYKYSEKISMCCTVNTGFFFKTISY
ncbi:MAG: primase-helicase family protein [Fusobacterium sp.]